MPQRFDPTAYPLMVETDGEISERAFGLFDMMVGAFQQIGLSKDQAYDLACLGYNEAAKPFRDNGWK